MSGPLGSSMRGWQTWSFSVEDVGPAGSPRRPSSPHGIPALAPLHGGYLVAGLSCTRGSGSLAQSLFRCALLASSILSWSNFEATSIVVNCIS